MKKSMFILIALILLVSFIAIPAYAGYGCRKCNKEKGELESKFYKKVIFLFDHQDMLGLTEKQTQEIKKLKTDVKKSLIQNKADIEIIAIDIKSNLFYSDKIDVKATEKLIDEKYKFKKEKAKTLVRAYAQLEQILSQEQRDVLKSVRLEKRSKIDCQKSRCPMGAGGKMGTGKCPMMKASEAGSQ